MPKTKGIPISNPYERSDMYEGFKGEPPFLWGSPQHYLLLIIIQLMQKSHSIIQRVARI
jgi:hypothetical protein